MSNTKFNTTTGLTAEEIVNIIRVGGDCGVVNLHYCGLKVTYQSKEPASSIYQTYLQPITPEQATSQLPDGKASSQDELQRELMMVSDPLKFEESLLLEKEDE